MFTGVITALVTPMRGKDCEVDETALIELVERQIAAGIDGLVPCGTTGESPTLSTEEHLRVIEIVIKAAKKRVPVIAGAGSNSTGEAIALSMAARELGADGLLHVTPYYNRPTQEGLYQHFRAVAAAAALPVVLYNVPTRTAVDLLPETVERLAALPHVVAIKEATGSIPRTQAIVARCPKLAVLGGDDATAFALYAVGARGVISVVSNVAPREIADQWDHAAAGRWAEARALNERVMLPLADALFAETNPIAVKAAMAMQKQCSADLRLPLTPASAPVAERVRTTLTALGALVTVTAIPVVVTGAAGRMGRMVIAALADTPGARLAAALERPGAAELGRDAGELCGLGPDGVVVASDLEAALAAAPGGAFIDFTAPAATVAAARVCAARGVAMVIGTTGLSAADRQAIADAAGAIPIVLSANFSLGVNVLLGLATQAARMLEGFDLEVAEIHHGKKRDAPSGTALRIGEALAEGRAQSLAEVGVFARHGDVGPRTKREIGVMALRGGDVVGEHTAYFFGHGERIELTHRATSRETFARGAVRAATWAAGRAPGLYDMRSVLGL